MKFFSRVINVNVVSVFCKVGSNHLNVGVVGGVGNGIGGLRRSEWKEEIR